MPTTERTRSTRIPARADPEAAVVRQLDGLVQRLVDRRDVHHAVAAAESLDGSFRWMCALGEAHPDGSPMRSDTPYWIASVTKLYIAAAVLKLHEQGRIDLAAPIATYLPDALAANLHTIGGIDRSDEITVRHLLTHASGLPDYLECRPSGGRSLMARVEEGDLSWTAREAVQIVREWGTPHFPPQPLADDRYKIRYSDTNYQLLIEILEVVTARPLQEAFEALLFAPLGLRDTYVPGTRATDRAPATVWTGDRPLQAPEAMRSFRDLISTADETLRFLRALVAGEVFDDPRTLELMRGGWNTFGFSLNPSPIAPTWPIDYGHGMMRFRIPRLLSLGRPSPPILGHTGASGSWLFHVPELDLLLSGTVDQTTAAALPYRFVPRMLPILAALRR